MRTLFTLVSMLSFFGCDNDNDHGPPPSDFSTSGQDLSTPAGGDMAGLTTQRLMRTDIVSDQAGATRTDATLVNAWGLAFNPSGPAWVASNKNGVTNVYDANGMTLLAVTIPPAAGGTPPSAPTGQVFNPTTGFMGDLFILSTEDGTIAGWQTGATATLRHDASAGGAIYKGLALLTHAGATRLYAADFHNGHIDVFDSTYTKITTTGGFVDQGIPTGFAPFNVQAIGTMLYVTYAMQDAMAEDDVSGAGHGYIDVYDFDGALQRRFASQGALNSPWAVVQAPASFGALSNMILVGNFGDGTIHGFDATTGALTAMATDSAGAPLVIDGLWALVFGPGAASSQLFFTAGPAGETHGVYGRLTAQ